MGLLAGVWQFPNVAGWLEPEKAPEAVEAMCSKPRELLRQIHRKHIFTHIEWEMQGIYLETAGISGNFVWMTAEEIKGKAALPTAFRQFWEEEQGVCLSYALYGIL